MSLTIPTYTQPTIAVIYLDISVLYICNFYIMLFPETGTFNSDSNWNTYMLTLAIIIL